MSNKPLTYFDFATDEALYLCQAYNAGFRFNAMVSQAQRICECYLKHLIYTRMMNNDEVMMSHNLRKLYDYISDMGIDLSALRADIMVLNVFYNHTRYPGKDSFMASEADIDSAVKAIQNIAREIVRYY